MPRYTTSPQGTQIIAATVPAVATGVDAETPLLQVPFDGYLSVVRYLAAAAYTGAGTNYRSLRVRNKYGGGGVTVMAQFDGTAGNNLAAFAPNAIPLGSAVPAAPAFSPQPTPTPTVAPSLTAGTGALTSGTYLVAYSYVLNGVEGQTSPYASIAMGGANGITVAAINVPPGVSAVRYYFLASPGTAGLVTSQANGAAVTLNAQGNGTNPAGYSVMDVTTGDVLTLYSLHQGTGLADPGGELMLTLTRS